MDYDVIAYTFSGAAIAGLAIAKAIYETKKYVSQFRVYRKSFVDKLQRDSEYWQKQYKSAIANNTQATIGGQLTLFDADHETEHYDRILYFPVNGNTYSIYSSELRKLNQGLIPIKRGKSELWILPEDKQDKDREINLYRKVR